MADNPNHQLNTDQIRELLSPYLDGEVTDEERDLVEQALAASAELQDELATLRRTIALVTALPPIPAPRPFTLTEADVRAIAPASKNLFGLPTWVKVWAPLAATLLCILAAGGLFWSMQFGQVSRQAAAPAAEIASAPESAATATNEEVQSAAAPAESAAQREAEPSPSETTITDEAAPAGEENVADAPQEKAAITAMPTTTESAAANLAQSPTDEVALEAAPAGEATEADQSTPAEDTVAGAAAPASSPPAPTTAPAPETLTFAAPVTEAVEEEAASAAAAESEQPATESAAPPAAAEPAQPGQQERGTLPRLVEVENLNLELSPGLIQVRGTIEATPGSTLSATLQRNGEPFDSWADPATLQTTVQPNGQFSLIIQASAGRIDQDLFAVEPASYQLSLTSLDGTEPVMAVVPFDTFRPPAVATLTATSSPQPSATPLARLTLPVPDTPSGTATAAATSLPAEVSPSAPGWLIAATIVGLAALVTIIGLVVWLIRHNQNRGPR